MHIAIIMDGNGRWAARRHLPRVAGHREGAQAANRIVEAAACAGVDTLSLYAFSSDNWRRPADEVQALFSLLRHHLLSQTRRCLEQSIRINIIGRRDRLNTKLLRLIRHSEEVTAHCAGMHLRIAIDYSSRHSLIEAARSTQSLARIDANAPAVDLMIRTGGEKRLSDFLLFECAYAELHFVDCLWPDFDATAFGAALHDFSLRERRFGGLAPATQAAAPHG